MHLREITGNRFRDNARIYNSNVVYNHSLNKKTQEGEIQNALGTYI